jgi:hypothetical protein
MLVLMLTLMLDAGFDYDSKNFKSRFSQCSKFRQNDHEQEPVSMRERPEMGTSKTEPARHAVAPAKAGTLKA